MMNPTTYLRPKTLEEALHKLNRPDSTALSGGGLLLRGVRLPFATVIDMQDLAEFKRITYDNGQLVLGGNASLEAVYRSDYLMPHLRDALGRVLSVNQRAGISIHESLASSAAPRDWWAALVALSARVSHTGFEKGRLTTDAYQFQPLEQFLNDCAYYGEPYAGFVQALHITIPHGRTAFGSSFVARTPRDIAIVNAAALVTLDDDGLVKEARVTVAGVSRKEDVARINTDTLIGQHLDADVIDAFATHAAERIIPTSDYRGSEAYRHAMARVMMRRALLDARAQLPIPVAD